MSLLTTAKGAQHNIAAKVIEESGDYTTSVSKGRLFKFKELPGSMPLLIKLVENTAYYKEEGYASFYLSTIGLTIDGLYYNFNGLYYKFNPFGNSTEEMFLPIRDRNGKTSDKGGDIHEIEQKYHQLPFEKWGSLTLAGGKPFMVFISRHPGKSDSRISIVSFLPFSSVASVIVVHKDDTASPTPPNQTPNALIVESNPAYVEQLREGTMEALRSIYPSFTQANLEVARRYDEAERIIKIKKPDCVILNGYMQEHGPTDVLSYIGYKLVGPILDANKGAVIIGTCPVKLDCISIYEPDAFIKATDQSTIRTELIQRLGEIKR